MPENQKRIKNTLIELTQGDITELDTDAIINAANTGLILGGGVAGAIRAKGGPEIQKECHLKAPIQVGGAAITTGGNLKARYVIHAAGPRMGEGNEREKLADAVRNSLVLADEHLLKTIAFPAISTGIFGYPVQACAEVMLVVTAEYLQGTTGLSKVIFCLYDRNSYDIFCRRLLTGDM